MEPAGHRVLIKPDEVESVSEGGIIVHTDSAKKLEEAGVRKGVIHSIGKTAWIGFANDEPWAKVGDRVYFAKYSGTRLEDPQTKEDLILVRDEDVIAILEEGTDYNDG